MKLFVNKRKFIAFLFVLTFVFPFYVEAQSAPEDLNLTAEYSASDPSRDPTGFQIVPPCSRNGEAECGWKDLLILVRNIMGLMLYLSATIAVIAFVYAGFLYMTSFGDMGKVEQAHGIFSKVIIGFIFVFLGWLIVATILKTIGVQEGYNIIDSDSVTEVRNPN